MIGREPSQGEIKMSAIFRPFLAAAALWIAVSHVCFAQCPTVGVTAESGRAIQLSPADSITPETRWQIEQANFLLKQLARRAIQLRRWVAMPVP
jgi:hypothetical protein